MPPTPKRTFRACASQQQRLLDQHETPFRELVRVFDLADARLAILLVSSGFVKWTFLVHALSTQRHIALTRTGGFSPNFEHAPGFRSIRVE